MKLISFDDIKKQNINPLECLDWVSFVIKNKNKNILQPKISLKPFEGVFCNVMPSILTDENGYMWGGVKVVTRYPNREPSLDSRILLFDAKNGDFKALLDGDWITTMRTGAVAAHSIKLFAKKNYETIGIIGLGNTARASLLCLLESEKNRKFVIKLLKYKNQAELFIERFKNFDNVSFSIIDNMYDLVKGSDVVISAVTYFSEDICDDSAFDEGVLVVPVHTRGFSNCDLFFDKVYGDDYGHICHFKYFDKFRYFSEVCDVVNGKNKGRENDKERILAYNIGISLHDIYYASKIYNMCKDKNLIEIDTLSPTDKFWI